MNLVLLAALGATGLALFLVLVLNALAAVAYHRDPDTHAARRILAGNTQE